MGAATDTYNDLLNVIARNGTSHYIVANNPGASLLCQRISTGLTVTATPPQATVILKWINSGAPGERDLVGAAGIEPATLSLEG